LYVAHNYKPFGGMLTFMIQVTHIHGLLGQVSVFLEINEKHSRKYIQLFPFDTSRVTEFEVSKNSFVVAYVFLAAVTSYRVVA
jgi:hypothetical protein